MLLQPPVMVLRCPSSPQIRAKPGYSTRPIASSRLTITLLVFDIVRPGYVAGHLFEKLQAQWPNYIAFLASFFYVGIMWLNHRAVFSRVRYCSRSLHLANLLLLLTSALIPFPTAVLSTALQIGNRVDAAVAVVLYAAVGGLMCLSWLLLFHVLSINPHLLEDHVESTFFGNFILGKPNGYR